MNKTDCNFVTLRVPTEYFSGLVNIYQKWLDICDRQSEFEDRLDESNPEHARIMSSTENDLAKHRSLFEAASRLCMEFAVICHDCETTLHEFASNSSGDINQGPEKGVNDGKLV